MRNVLVTGGSRGLGLGIARELARAGYRVLAVARKPGEALDAAVRETGGPEGSDKDVRGRITFVPFDLADVDAIPAFVRALRAEHGKLYGLVNNAGLGTEGLLATMHNSAIEALIRLNTLSPIVLTKYVVRGMMADGEGRIVNMASIIGSTGFNGLSVYGATKASLIGFTRSLAREVGRVGVTVNAVAPGFVATEMTGNLVGEARERVTRRAALRRLAEVEDVARMVAFLLGEGGRNITGTVMTVDAGNTA